MIVIRVIMRLLFTHIHNNYKTCRLYGSISVNLLDKPRRDEIRVGDKVKGGLCVVRGRSKLRQRYQSSCATESKTFTATTTKTSMREKYRSVRNSKISKYATKLFDLTIIEALPCDHLAIASTHDPSSRYHCAKEKSRGDSMVSLIRSARRGSVARSIRPIEHALDQDDLRSRPAYARSG